MNFYIGNSIDEIDEQDVNIEFSDELIDFIYKMSGRVSFDMSKLYKIDPYDDVEVSKNDLSPIAKICKYIFRAQRCFRIMKNQMKADKCYKIY